MSVSRALVKGDSDESRQPAVKAARASSDPDVVVPMDVAPASDSHAVSRRRPTLAVSCRVRTLVDRGGFPAGYVGKVCGEEWTTWRGWGVRMTGVTDDSMAFNAATTIKFKAKELEVCG